MISKSPLPDFNKKFEAAGVFIECNGKILILHRNDGNPDGDPWGTPGGGVDPGETPLQAVVREIKEEVGLSISPENCKFFERYYVRYPKADFIYHRFHTRLDDYPELNVDPKESKAYAWLNPEECLKLNLIMDEDSCIKWFFNLE